MKPAPVRANPLAAALLEGWSARVANWIGPATVLPVLFTVGFLALFTWIVATRTADYYRGLSAPPSFRHLDAMDLKRVLIDYLDAHDAGPDTVLVLGDCVAFGHGVIEPFPALMQLPGYRLLNVSMQSFRYDLMLVVIDQALKRGVKNVIVQLHPFEDYQAEAAFWKRLQAQRLGTTVDRVPAASSLSAGQLVDAAEQNWRVIALSHLEGTERFYDYRAHFPTASLSAALRYDVLSAWPLYRDRFAFDDWSGLRLSYFTSRTHRTDSYVDTLPEAQQRDIFKSQADFFAKFIIHDRAAYAAEMSSYSAAARIARVLSDNGANALFIMAPTFVNKLEANTALTGDDLAFASDTMRQIAGRYSFPYLDYLRDPELDAQMVHFDNLTARGQRLLAEKLTADLARIRFPGAGAASRR